MTRDLQQSSGKERMQNEDINYKFQQKRISHWRNAQLDFRRRRHEVEAFTKSKYTKKILDESQVEADDKAFRNVKEFAKPIDSSLRDWTGRRFAESDAIIFIGACGIAVRSIAPFVSSKKTDPAVVVIDEQGKFAISLLSGHIGGANELTEEISNLLHATPVITTATDINNKFAVDVFAKTNGCYISDMTMAKEISAALVNGNSVGFASDFPWVGEIPKELQLLDEEDETKKNRRWEFM